MEAVDLHLQRLRQLGDAPLKPCSLISDRFLPIPPHKVGIAHLVLKPRFLLADPVGCGKTPQALAAYGFLKQRDPKLRVITMCERSVMGQWSDSVEMFLNGIKPKVVGYDYETGKPLDRLSRYDAYEKSSADVFFLSYHQMARDIDIILHNIDSYVIIFDEVQTLKTYRDAGTGSRNSLYHSALKLSTKARYVWGLSATPQMNGRLEELYAIMEVIRPGTFGSFDAFKARYLEFKEQYVTAGVDAHGKRRLRSYQKVNGYKNIPEVMWMIRPFYIKRKSEEINKHLPKIVTKTVELEMLPEQERVYDAIINRHFPARGEIRRLSKLASLTYAQLASDGPQTLGLQGDSSKMVELLRNFGEEINDEKVIIYARFRRTIDYICSKLEEVGIKHVRITGAEKTGQRNTARLVFNNPSSGTNVICINKAGGTSLDLQQASIVIFYDLPWSWGEWDQVLGRARRIGSPHEKVLALILTNKKTIDEHVLTTLRKKEKLVEEGIGVDTRTLEFEVDEPVSRLYEMVRRKVA